MTRVLLALLIAGGSIGSACGDRQSDAPLAPSVAASPTALNASAPALFDDEQSSSGAPVQPPATRSRNATVNVGAIGLDAAAATSRVLLNLFRDTQYVAVFDHLQSAPISRSWIGAIDGVANSEVVLAVSGGVFAATISLPNAYYTVMPADGGRYLIAQIDRDAMRPPD